MILLQAGPAATYSPTTPSMGAHWGGRAGSRSVSVATNLFLGSRGRHRDRWRWRDRGRLWCCRRGGGGARSVCRSAVAALRAKVQHDTLVDGNVHLVFLLDQFLHTFWMSASRRRRAFATAVVTTWHQGTNLLALDAPTRFRFLLHFANYLATRFDTCRVPAAPIAASHLARAVCCGCRPNSEQRHRKQHDYSTFPHDVIS